MVKERLVDSLLEGVELSAILEWLWEDYGIRVKRSKESVRRAILRSDEITPQDLAVFMLDNGVEVSEDAWEGYSDPL